MPAPPTEGSKAMELRWPPSLEPTEKTGQHPEAPKWPNPSVVPEEAETVSSDLGALGSTHCARKKGIDPERKWAGQDPHVHGRARQRPSLLLAVHGSCLRGMFGNRTSQSTPVLSIAPLGPKNRRPPTPATSFSCPVSGPGFFYYNNSEVVYFQNKDTQFVPSTNILRPSALSGTKLPSPAMES